MATIIGMPALGGLSGGGNIDLMDILKLFMHLRQQKELGGLMTQMGEQMPTRMEGWEQMEPSKGIPEGAGYEPGIFQPGPGGLTMPFQTQAAMILRDPTKSPEAKMMALKMLQGLQPQKKEYLTLGPGQEAIDITTGKRISGPPKATHLQAIQGEDNWWTFNPDTGELKETNTPIKGKPQWSDPEEDPVGNLIQKNLKTGEVKVISKTQKGEAPKTRTYKKNGKLVTEEWEADLKKWKPVAEAPREIEKPGEELKAAKAKEVRDIIGQRFGVTKLVGYEDLDEVTKSIHDSVLEKAQKNAHTMDSAAAVNKAIKDLKESKTYKVYEREATYNPETKKWEYPEGKGYTGRWKYWGESAWKEAEKPKGASRDRAIEFLKTNNAPLTEGNIKAVIKKYGW